MVLLDIIRLSMGSRIAFNFIANIGGDTDDNIGFGTNQMVLQT